MAMQSMADSTGIGRTPLGISRFAFLSAPGPSRLDVFGDKIAVRQSQDMANTLSSDPALEELFVENLPLIDGIIHGCCRTSRFTPQEGEDFGQHVRLKLIEDDYGVFRKFRGRSSLKTYLTKVIARLLLDYQNHLWQKWRPSAEAERLGPVALRLEQFRFRDGLSFDEACEKLWQEDVVMSAMDLAELEAKLPPRRPRQFESVTAIENRESSERPPDVIFADQEREAGLRRIYGTLYLALPVLSSEERILVRLWMDLKVSQIARVLKVDQKPLYPKLAKAFKKLKEELERQGVGRREVAGLLGDLRRRRDGPEDPKEVAGRTGRKGVILYTRPSK